MMGALASLLLLGLWGQPVDPPEPPLEEIVVTGRRANDVAFGSPVELFRRHCFDAQRRRQRFLPAAPANDHWQPLGAEVRERLGIADPEATLVGLVDHVLGHSLVLRIERTAREGGLVEDRCSLTVIGGSSHDALQRGMAALFRGPGTGRHVGHPAGSPKLPGWQQHAWTAMPPRGSVNWRDAAAASRQPGGTFIVVTSPSFYDEYAYVLGDLKMRVDRLPRISILALAHTRRERRR